MFSYDYFFIVIRSHKSFLYKRLSPTSSHKRLSHPNGSQPNSITLLPRAERTPSSLSCSPNHTSRCTYILQSFIRFVPDHISPGYPALTLSSAKPQMSSTAHSLAGYLPNLISLTIALSPLTLLNIYNVFLYEGRTNG